MQVKYLILEPCDHKEKTMKKLLLCPLLILFFTISVFSQSDAPTVGFDKSKLFLGGNFGLSFGSYTLINLSPQLGYHFTNYFAAGAGINLLYSSVHYTYPYEYKDEYGAAGLNVFGRFYPIQNIMLQIQPELNYVWGDEKYYDGTPSIKLANTFVPSLLMGGGVAIPAGKGALLATLMYDVLQNPESPYYQRAVFNLGYNIGF
jgi:hypothetical protein